jgi:type VI secretion system protein ImpH
MAAEGRASDLAVERYALEQDLIEEPFRFDFFQAVRLLEKFVPGRVPVGRFAKPRDEVVRFAVHNSVVFPASQIQRLAWREGLAPLMTVNFMGLTGPVGALPLYYTLMLAERARVRDTGIRDFFDIFNHRIISLFYQAWEKYRFAVEYERRGRDPFLHHLLDMIGLGTAGLAGRQAVADDALAFYAGILSQCPRSAVAFQQLLEDYFEVPVEVVQFAGAWYRLSRDMQTCLDNGDTVSEQLAFGVVAGDEVWDEQSRVRIRLGPLTLRQYLDFLPTGTAFAPLRAMARFYAGDQMDFEAQLILARGEVPICELGREDESGPRLGWVSWSKVAAMGRDPEDTVLEL